MRIALMKKSNQYDVIVIGVGRAAERFVGDHLDKYKRLWIESLPLSLGLALVIGCAQSHESVVRPVPSGEGVERKYAASPEQGALHPLHAQSLAKHQAAWAAADTYKSVKKVQVNWSAPRELTQTE